MRRSLLFFTLFFFASAYSLKAQSCFNVYAAGGDIFTSCTNLCPSITFHIPNIRTTDDYKVISIPYEPYPFTNAGGVVFDATYIDDSYSDIINLPFTFCFYGNNYTQCVVGTNGILTFDIANANTFNSWYLNQGDASDPRPGPIQRIPYAGGSIGAQSEAYYPRASIMGPYHDMDPQTTPVPADRRMEYIITGTAPCRKFTLNFYEVPFYGCPTDEPANSVTQQMVLYEGTGIIDIFIKNKPRACPDASNEGRAILGIQNWEQNRAVAVPGRNNTVWSAVNEGWRFVPNGATSLLSHVDLYKNNVLLTLPPPTVNDPGTGELEVTFPQVCQPEDSMSYVVKAFYKQCDNPANEAEGSDTIIVKKTLNPLMITAADALCGGASNGKITITDPVAPNIEYSIDGGTTWQTSNTFLKPAGTYTIIARVIGSTCTGSANATVSNPPPIAITPSINPVTCHGLATGVIEITDYPGNPDYEYSKDGGVTWQPSNIFSVPAGHYTVTVRKISANCTNNISLDVTEPNALNATAITQPATCANNDGVLTIAAGGGTTPYLFSIDGGTNTQSTPDFTGLDTATYSKVQVKDANGCLKIITPVVLGLNDNMTLSLGNDTTICVGQSVTLSPQTNTETDIFNWTQLPNNNTLSGTSIKNPVATPTITTKYTLNAAFGICKRTDDITLTVLNKPIPNAGLDTTICAKTPVFLHGSAANLSGPAYYSWSPDTKLIYTSADSSRAIAKPDTLQQYVFNVKDNYGCNFSVSDSMTVFINPPIIPFAGNDTIAAYGKPHQLKATGGVKYMWRPADHLNNPFIADPLAILTVDTYFSVLVYDNIGCVASDDIFVKVYEGPNYYVPNTFTPNGDGLNDVFRPVPAGIKTTNYFRVFSRSGQLLFETNQYLKGWDGTFKGQKQPQGVYVWVISGIDANGVVIEDKGTVLMLR